MISSNAQEPIKVLVEEFRSHLQTFYAGLKLAPPYESIEKALVHLAQRLKAMDVDQQARLLNDAALRWECYTASFAGAGLSRKHRGIITGLVRSCQIELPEDYRPWLKLFSESL
jgi:hypothetical protein